MSEKKQDQKKQDLNLRIFHFSSRESVTTESQACPRVIDAACSCDNQALVNTALQRVD
jgi:hypothetical protein